MTQIDTFTDILRARSSCRAFRPDPVDDAIITRIVDAARHVPSWCNAQPWQLTITKGAATDRFRDALALEIAKGTPPRPRSGLADLLQRRLRRPAADLRVPAL